MKRNEMKWIGMERAANQIGPIIRSRPVNNKPLGLANLSGSSCELEADLFGKYAAPPEGPLEGRYKWSGAKT